MWTSFSGHPSPLRSIADYRIRVVRPLASLAVSRVPPPVRSDPAIHPRQQRVGRNGEEKGQREEGGIAPHVGDLAADGSHDRSRQGVERGEQGVLGRGLALV